MTAIKQDVMAPYDYLDIHRKINNVLLSTDPIVVHYVINVRNKKIQSAVLLRQFALLGGTLTGKVLLML